MTDQAAPAEAGRRAGRTGILWVGGAGAAAPLALWALGAAQGWPALGASCLVALLVAVVWMLGRRRSPGEVQPAAARTPTAAPSAAGPPFGAILERLPDPILLVSGSEDGGLSARDFGFANAAARELLRIQRPSGPLTTAIRAPDVLAAIDKTLFEGVTSEASYQSGGVQDRVWRMVCAPLQAEGGQQRAVLTLRDETAFRRTERTRADFLANASHELRTPLASLTGFIETLRGHARDDEAAREKFLGIMHVQAERMRRLIEDLMSLSRIELGEHIPPSESVDLGVAMIDVIDALGPLAQERGVALAPTLPATGGAIVIGDRDQIVQVIQNLAENALKFSRKGSLVTVRVEAGLESSALSAPTPEFGHPFSLLAPDHAGAQRYAAVIVRDAGGGIARNNLPRLTERFYRVEGQKSEAGSGLGLAIVKHIVNRHKGGLAVESAEGKGTAFTAYFPMAEPAIEAKSG